MTWVDIHRHLDGSLRAKTCRELASELGIELPEPFRFTDGMGLQAALSLFEHSLRLLATPSAVRRVASEICEDAIAEDVDTLEIRFAPQLHVGADIESIANAAAEGINGRAGLLLCVLYGETPALAESLVDLAAAHPGVVGIDLAGGPTPNHEFSMSDYAPAFQRARAEGLGITVHAGEGRPAEEIRTAVEQLGAQRIGHGTSILQDESIVRLCIDRGVTLEACPTSNVQTGILSHTREHPLPQWLKAGLKATVNTDNTLFSDVDAPTEWQRASQIEGMTPELVNLALEHGRQAKF